MPRFHASYELYDQNLLLIRWLANFCGVDMMVEHYRFNYRTAFCVAVQLYAFVGSIYSMAFYYPDYYKMCEAFFPLCLSLQGATKFYYGYIHRDFYRVQYERLRSLHFRHRNHARNNADLLWLMERIHLVTRLMTVVYCAGGLVYLLYPIYMYWTHGQRELIIALEIPGIDSGTTSGYVTVVCIQFLVVVVASAGFAAADTVIVLFVASLAAYADVFANELDELNERILGEDLPRNEELIREKVRNICVQHQDIIEYESDLDERYIVICFVQVVTSIGAMSAMLFLVYMVQFMPGYVMLLAIFCQFFEICLLGTILTVKNEDITDAIYGVQWYLLEKPEQKCVSLMLHKSQHFVEMTVGGFAPVNLETFVSIMNRIYSYFMMLISFIE